MATPRPLKSQEAYIEVEQTANSGTWYFLCIADQFDYTINPDYDEYFLNDCADPSALPARNLDIKTVTRTYDVQGVCSPGDAAYVIVRGLAESGDSWNFKFWRKAGAANGGYYETAAVKLRNFKESKPQNGTVRASFQIDIVGAVTKTSET